MAQNGDKTFVFMPVKTDKNEWKMVVGFSSSYAAFVFQRLFGRFIKTIYAWRYDSNN